MDMNSLNGPLSDIAARNTHKMAITRDYISQPRISKWFYSEMNSDKANIVGRSTNICPEQHRYAKYVDQDTRLRGPGCSSINCLSSDNINL